MDNNSIEQLISTLRNYSAEASYILKYLSKYDYREEARNWDSSNQPTLIEAEHPTLRDLYLRLAKYMGPVPHRPDNLDTEAQLNRNNISSFCNYLQVNRQTLIAARFNRIPIEPMLHISNAFKELNLQKESNRLLNIYNFAYGIRRWYHETKRGRNTTIEIKIEVNYDEAPIAAISADEGYTTFASLFKPSCNYSAKQKRALYNELQKLYATIEPETADRTVMAVILLFRKLGSKFRQPFGTKNIITCKEKAMAAFGRDVKTIRSYSGNSLTKPPKLGTEHVKRAESIIAKALDSI